jgi:radical SAM enzyme (TIGR01210 family)
MWTEDDMLDHQPVSAFVVILRTRGCFWANHSGCSMCGYFRDSNPAISEKDIQHQLAESLKGYGGQPIVKVFTSGSFFDTQEIPAVMQQDILDAFFSLAAQVSVETRPEFIARVRDIDVPVGKRLEIAMGLESANDCVLEYSIAKGFTYNQWRVAAEQVADAGHRLKVYILIKPPFLKEKEAIFDALTSANKVDDIANTISYNPVAVHGYTLVDFLWRRGLYRSPWLWSVVEVLTRSAEQMDSDIKCDVVAGGKPRGAHNCGTCDNVILDAIRSFSLYKNPTIFDDINCDCQEEWLDTLELEDFLQG